MHVRGRYRTNKEAREPRTYSHPVMTLTLYVTLTRKNVPAFSSARISSGSTSSSNPRRDVAATFEEIRGSSSFTLYIRSQTLHTDKPAFLHLQRFRIYLLKLSVVWQMADFSFSVYHNIVYHNITSVLCTPHDQANKCFGRNMGQ